MPKYYEIKINSLNLLTMEQQQQRVIEICTAWGLYENTTEEKQILKFYTELGEYADAVLRDDRDAIIDAIGDMAVCLINAEVIENRLIGFGKPYCSFDNIYGIIDNLVIFVSCRNYKETLLILSSLSESHGTTLEHCLDTVIKVIEKRKGKMINGVFVKE